MRSRIDQHGAVVDHCVAVLGRAVFSGNLVVGDTAIRQLRPYAHFLLEAIGRMFAFNNVTTEARTRVLGNAARRCSSSGADRSPNRTANDATHDRPSDRAARGAVLSDRDS